MAGQTSNETTKQLDAYLSGIIDKLHLTGNISAAMNKIKKDFSAKEMKSDEEQLYDQIKSDAERRKGKKAEEDGFLTSCFVFTKNHIAKMSSQTNASKHALKTLEQLIGTARSAANGGYYIQLSAARLIWSNMSAYAQDLEGFVESDLNQETLVMIFTFLTIFYRSLNEDPYKQGKKLGFDFGKYILPVLQKCEQKLDSLKRISVKEPSEDGLTDGESSPTASEDGSLTSRSVTQFGQDVTDDAQLVTLSSDLLGMNVDGLYDYLSLDDPNLSKFKKTVLVFNLLTNSKTEEQLQAVLSLKMTLDILNKVGISPENLSLEDLWGLHKMDQLLLSTARDWLSTVPRSSRASELEKLTDLDESLKSELAEKLGLSSKKTIIGRLGTLFSPQKSKDAVKDGSEHSKSRGPSKSS